MMSQVASYPLTLLNLMDEDYKSTGQLPLGMAQRSGAQSTTFKIPAHKVLQALITHAQSPRTIAQELLVELGKCRNSIVETLVEEVYNEECALAADDWAVLVLQKLQESPGDLSTVTQLGSHYLTHLVIAFRNPGGKKTPQNTTHPTPNHRRIGEIEELLAQATIRRSQSALRDLVILRDGDHCLLTGFSFFRPNPVVARCAHIIPFSAHSKTQTHAVIERFTGSALNVQTILANINHPCNALNLQGDAHDSMDKYLAWGIEAIPSDGQCKYYYRVVRPDVVSPITRLRDGDEIHFGEGTGGHRVPLPNPRICNLRLAVCRVSYACGASEIFDQFLEDEDDDGFQVPVYFGGPFVSDDVLMRRLEAAVY